MRCVFNFLNEPQVIPRGTSDPIIIKLGDVIHSLIKCVHVEFHRSNKIFKPIIITKHIFLRGSILNQGSIMDRPEQSFAI